MIGGCELNYAMTETSVSIETAKPQVYNDRLFIKLKKSSEM